MCIISLLDFGHSSPSPAYAGFKQSNADPAKNRILASLNEQLPVPAGPKHRAGTKKYLYENAL